MFGVFWRLAEPPRPFWLLASWLVLVGAVGLSLASIGGSTAKAGVPLWVALVVTQLVVWSTSRGPDGPPPADQGAPPEASTYRRHSDPQAGSGAPT